MDDFQLHPFINACLNATAAAFLIRGWFAIRAGQREVHRRAMLSAFAASSVFLVSYLIRFAVSGTHKYPGEGIGKAVYLFTLFSHMILAVAVVPMVLRSLFLALKGRYPEHRRLVKYTWPIWLYVSVTGVMVYVMLYHIGPSLR